MELSPLQVIILCVGWLLYGVLHSFTASLWLKQRIAGKWPRLMPYYRLAFNALGLLSLIPLLLLIIIWHGDYLWQWRGVGWFIANGLALLALFGFGWSLRYYDGAEFLGLRQWRRRERRAEDQERFTLSPLHRFVRHPWYFLGLVILWTRDMDAVLLVSSLLISGYIVIGARLEERKLVAFHGARYRRYQALVPALFPLPWRFLSRANAAALEQVEKGGKDGASALQDPD